MSKTKPRVSVIMAEYSTNPQYFKEAVDSVLKQTYKNFEFIIVDDSGVNRVEKLLDGYSDSRIRIIKNPGNKGFVYALNNGIKNAKNDYIIRMDTDDIATPDRFEIIINYAVEHAPSSCPTPWRSASSAPAWCAGAASSWRSPAA